MEVGWLSCDLGMERRGEERRGEEEGCLFVWGEEEEEGFEIWVVIGLLRFCLYGGKDRGRGGCPSVGYWE